MASKFTPCILIRVKFKTGVTSDKFHPSGRYVVPRSSRGKHQYKCPTLFGIKVDDATTFAVIRIYFSRFIGECTRTPRALEGRIVAALDRRYIYVTNYYGLYVLPLWGHKLGCLTEFLKSCMHVQAGCNCIPDGNSIGSATALWFSRLCTAQLT